MKTPVISAAKARAWLEVLSTVAVIAVCATLVYTLLTGRSSQASAGPAQPTAGRSERAAPPVSLPQAPVPIGDAALKGNRDARVVLVEFSEFECPFCVRFTHDAWPMIDEAFVKTGKVLFAFRHLPLEGIHRDAFKAAEAAQCAGAQGKFWEMHDLLFQRPAALKVAQHVARAKGLGLNPDSFQTCLAGAEAPSIRRDLAIAQRLSVKGTPTFFVGLRDGADTIRVVERFAGAQSFEFFREKLERHLTAAR